MRRLIAALACRSGGSRLYGKPLQNLVGGVTILDQILATVAALPAIERSVLGIAEGVENLAFVEFAQRRGLAYALGDEIDVLSRLIACGRLTRATDVFRVTTECPYMHHEAVAEAWRRHVESGNDVTTIDGLPAGTHFEIYTLDALERSHEHGNAHHRSEGCSRYIREHRSDFKVEVLEPPADLARMDLRLTVDYPEDLVVCRRIYERLKDRAPLIPLREVVAFMDANPSLKALVAPYTSSNRLWPPDA